MLQCRKFIWLNAGQRVIQSYGSLAEWLKAKKRATGQSQRYIASKTHIAAGTISAIVHGHVPSPDIVKTLAAHFGDDPDTVLEIAKIVRLSDGASELPEDWRALYRRASSLNEAQQTFVKEQLAHYLAFFESGEEAKPR
jgi:transcriptional regulator with XRE-family HTH domain